MVMTLAMTVERAGKDDFDELMAMLLKAYVINSPEHPPFPQLYPDVYQPTAESMDQCRIIRHEGKIIGHVGVFDIPLCINDQKVVIPGIGGVATDPDYRDKGVMRTLMDHVQSELVQQGQPFAWLSGDRRRYMRWGFEMVVPSFGFTLLDWAPGYADYAGKLAEPMRQVNIDEDRDWDIIWKQVQKNPKLAVCGEQTLRLKYKRHAMEVFCSGGEDGAHIVVLWEDTNIRLTGWGGDPEIMGQLIAELINQKQFSVSAVLPWYPDAYCAVFKQLMTRYDMCGYGNIAVLNLARTLAIFKQHLDQRVRQFGLKGSVNLSVDSVGNIPKETLRLEADGNELIVSPADKADVELNRFQIVELMFTPLVVGYSVRLLERAKWLTNLFPLPFYMPWLCRV